jgi:ABC-type transport system involved in multi-copper enzyme maturation permease subunit
MAVFFYDLLRTTRRGRVALFRTLYALALLAALYSVYARWFSRDKAAMDALPPSAMARFAEEFVGLFLYIQMGAVVLLTPAYTAGAIAEERQRGTLEMLLTTHLTSTQIVVGKFAARLAHLLGILLTGLPILALLPLWGGVAPALILSGFAVTGLSALSLAALSIWLSVYARTVRGAIAGTYVYTVVICVCPFFACLNVFFLLMSEFQHANLLDFATGIGVSAGSHLFVTFMLLVAAVRGLRKPRGPAIDRRAVPTVEAGDRGRRETWPHRKRFFGPPPVGDRPLLWKELHFGGSDEARIVGRVLQVFGFIFGMVVTSIFLIAALSTEDDYDRGELNVLIRVMTVLVLLTATIGTLMQATASVGREREEGTLDMLLTLPDGRDELLGAKWLGSALCGRWLLLGLFLFLVFGVLAGGLHPLALLAIVLAAVIHLAFAASLGIFLSVATRSTGRAAMLAVVFLLALCLAPIAFCSGGYGSVPPVAWVMCLPLRLRDTAWEGAPPEAVAMLVGLVAYAGLAWLFWALAVREFLGQRRPHRFVRQPLVH